MTKKKPGAVRGRPTVLGGVLKDGQQVKATVTDAQFNKFKLLAGDRGRSLGEWTEGKKIGKLSALVRATILPLIGERPPQLTDVFLVRRLETLAADGNRIAAAILSYQEKEATEEV